MNAGVTFPPTGAPHDVGPSVPARKRVRRTLILLTIVSVLPVAASYFAFYLWQPQGRVNHGDLLRPTALPLNGLPGVGGQGGFARAELEGKWTLLVAAPADCDAACSRVLYVSRQARLAQAKELPRVGRLFLVKGAGEPATDLLQRHEGLRVARADAGWLAALPGADAAGAQLYLIDPLGNVMMRFSDDIDTIRSARGVTKDLQRLLKYSALGRGSGSGE